MSAKKITVKLSDKEKRNWVINSDEKFQQYLKAANAVALVDGPDYVSVFEELKSEVEYTLWRGEQAPQAPTITFDHLRHLHGLLQSLDTESGIGKHQLSVKPRDSRRRKKDDGSDSERISFGGSEFDSDRIELLPIAVKELGFSDAFPAYVPATLLAQQQVPWEDYKWAVCEDSVRLEREDHVKNTKPITEKLQSHAAPPNSKVVCVTNKVVFGLDRQLAWVRDKNLKLLQTKTDYLCVLQNYVSSASKGSIPQAYPGLLWLLETKTPNNWANQASNEAQAFTQFCGVNFIMRQMFEHMKRTTCAPVLLTTLESGCAVLYCEQRADIPLNLVFEHKDWEVTVLVCHLASVDQGLQLLNHIGKERADYLSENSSPARFPVARVDNNDDDDNDGDGEDRACRHNEHDGSQQPPLSASSVNPSADNGTQLTAANAVQPRSACANLSASDIEAIRQYDLMDAVFRESIRTPDPTFRPSLASSWLLLDECFKHSSDGGPQLPPAVTAHVRMTMQI